MEIVRISALSPPDKAKSKWARDLLAVALNEGLAAKPVPAHTLQSFTVTLPIQMARHLQQQAELKSGALSTPVYAAGLIAAAMEKQLTDDACEEKTTVTASPTATPGIDRVRPLLHGLLNSAIEQSELGKIVFAEAATGTGKGRVIASLAAHSVQQGRTAVISAPLAVTWQLIEQLGALKKETPFTMAMALGRPNFVSPESVRAWAQANAHSELLDWIDSGGKVLSDRAAMASQFIGREIGWLLEDALSLAEDLPVSAVMLTEGVDATECVGEQMYQSLRNRSDEKVNIYLCSHYMLAAHARQMQIRKKSEGDNENRYLLPTYIDTLIVDEAHQLETAFAAINSHVLHLRTLERAVEADVKRGRKALLAAFSDLGRYIQQAGKKTARIDGFEAIVPVLQNVITAIEATPRKTLSAHTKSLLNVALNGARAALSGYMTLSMDVSPVRRYPQLTIGRASLEAAMQTLWDCSACAMLVSATLYGEENSAKLMRWKLGVPVDRAIYLPPVNPDWIYMPVTLHKPLFTHAPDDSDDWADEAAELIQKTALKAVGGTLVLCTSFQNTEQLAKRLAVTLGSRLIIQSQNKSASACAVQYKALYRSGLKPVWLGLGAAWTGIDLSDEDVPPQEDRMLTDLIITRMPLGISRTMMHERRVRIYGFSIVLQEAIWHLRQGLGRLVRREGVVSKNLWILDSRLSGSEAWAKRLNKHLLHHYKTQT